MKRFEDLKPEKRERILQAAMEEFSKHGYQRASTQQIARKAEISKSALFYYFGTKEELFLYLIDFANEFLERIVLQERPRIMQMDFFDHLTELTKFKLRMYHQHPQIFHFLMTVFLDPDYQEDCKRKIIEAFERYSTLIQPELDPSKFKEGVDVEFSLNMLGYLIQGYLSNVRFKADDNLQDLEAEVEKMMTLLKKALYRDEFLD